MYAFIFFLFSCITCINIASKIKNNSAIFIADIIHDNFDFVNYTYLSDILVVLQLIFTLFILEMRQYNEVFVIMGITQLLKIICSISTVLPPLKRYDDKIRLGGINGSGTEYIFSGHASYSALSTLYIYQNGYLGFFPLFIYNLFSQFLMTASRNHYTVDIVLAWIIVPLLYIIVVGEYNVC